MSKQVTYDGSGKFEVRFSFDRRLVDLVKGLPGRRWHPSDKFWSVPEEHVVPLVDLLLPEGFGFDEVTCEIYRMHGGSHDLEPAKAPAGPPGQSSLFGATESPDGAAANPGEGSPGDYTVARLNEQVKAVLASGFPAPI